MRNERMSSIMRIAAGAYLIYISYTLIKSIIAGEVPNPTLFIMCVVLFIVLGGVILIFGIKGMIKLNKNDQDEEIVEDVDAIEVEDAVIEEDIEDEQKEL